MAVILLKEFLSCHAAESGHVEIPKHGRLYKVLKWARLDCCLWERCIRAKVLKIRSCRMQYVGNLDHISYFDDHEWRGFQCRDLDIFV